MNESKVKGEEAGGDGSKASKQDCVEDWINNLMRMSDIFEKNPSAIALRDILGGGVDNSSSNAASTTSNSKDGYKLLDEQVGENGGGVGKEKSRGGNEEGMGGTSYSSACRSFVKAAGSPLTAVKGDAGVAFDLKASYERQLEELKRKYEDVTLKNCKKEIDLKRAREDNKFFQDKLETAEGMINTLKGANAGLSQALKAAQKENIELKAKLSEVKNSTYDTFKTMVKNMTKISMQLNYGEDVLCLSGNEAGIIGTGSKIEERQGMHSAGGKERERAEMGAARNAGEESEVSKELSASDLSKSGGSCGDRQGSAGGSRILVTRISKEKMNVTPELEQPLEPIQTPDVANVILMRVDDPDNQGNNQQVTVVQKDEMEIEEQFQSSPAVDNSQSSMELRYPRGNKKSRVSTESRKKFKKITRQISNIKKSTGIRVSTSASERRLRSKVFTNKASSGQGDAGDKSKDKKSDRQANMEFKVHTVDSTKDEWFCVCGKKFANRKSMHGHIKLKTNIHAIKCTYCPKRFPRRDYLKNHVVSEHNKPFIYIYKRYENRK